MKYKKSMFSFRFQSYGRYLVKFCELFGGDYYECSMTDMFMIDDVKNEEEPTQDDMCRLALRVCSRGRHYDSNGNEIEE